MFELKKIQGGRTNVFEPERYDAKTGEAITFGEALVLSSGVLTKCGATVTPTHIALASVAAGDEKRSIPVGAVAHDQVYEVPLSVAPGNAVVPGAKLTISADGLNVTATTTDGVATVVSKNGAAAAGDKILVKF